MALKQDQMAVLSFVTDRSSSSVSQSKLVLCQLGNGQSLNNYYLLFYQSTGIREST